MQLWVCACVKWCFLLGRCANLHARDVLKVYIAHDESSHGENNHIREEEININKSEDSDNEGYNQPHTSFDNLCVDMGCLTKEEEEELQASRKKVMEFNKKKEV